MSREDREDYGGWQNIPFWYLECPAVYSFGPSGGHSLLDAKACYASTNQGLCFSKFDSSWVSNLFVAFSYWTPSLQLNENTTVLVITANPY